MTDLDRSSDVAARAEPRSVGGLRSLVRNSAGIMGTSVINSALGYGYWTLAARIMPAGAVGLGSALVSSMVIVSLLTHLGAGAGLISRLPHRAKPREWRLTVVAVLVAHVAATVVLAAGAVYIIGEFVPSLRLLIDSPTLAAWFVVGAAAWTSADLLDYVFIAERRASLMTLRNAATALTKVSTLAIIAFAASRPGATWLVVTWAVSAIVGTLAGLAACHYRVGKLGRVPLRSIGRELVLTARPALGHHFISVCGLLPTYLLPVVVTARLGPQQNAYFYVTWMVGSAIFMISPAVSSALFAEASHDRHRLRQLVSRSFVITIALLVAAATVLIAGGHLILRIFGSGYGSGFPLLVLLVVSAFPDAVSNIAVAVLRVHGQLARAGWLSAVIAFVVIPGAWLATPHWGILGPGIAWVAAQVCGALVVLLVARTPETARSRRAGITHPGPPSDVSTHRGADAVVVPSTIPGAND